MEIISFFELLSKIDFSIVHIYKEINLGADFLCNVRCRESRRTVYDEWKDIPRHLKGICKVDKWGLPNIRCKKFC